MNIIKLRLELIDSEEAQKQNDVVNYSSLKNPKKHGVVLHNEKRRTQL